MISVIIPTYKPGNYIFQCLNSLKRQTLDKSSFEILIILNGCKDPWYHEINEFIQSNLSGNNVMLIQTDMPGVSNARNIGIEQANGNYITFIDDDDFISKNFLEEFIRYADKDSIVISDCHGFLDDSSESLPFYGPHKAFQTCKQNNTQCILNARTLFNGPCMKLFPKSMISHMKFDRTLSYGEDSLFMFQVSRMVKQLRYTSEQSIYFRRFRNSSALTKREHKWFWINCGFNVTKKYINTWYRHPLSYNFIFFISRILAIWKGISFRLLERI